MGIGYMTKRSLKASEIQGNQYAHKEFGKFILDLRMAKGITQKRLSEMSGNSVSAISSLENGRSQSTPLFRYASLIIALGGELEISAGKAFENNS